MITLLLLACISCPKAGVAQTFIPIDYPGGTDTQLAGIDENNVVGYYDDSASGNTYGFIYNLSTSTYTTLSYPGATNGTYPGGISGNNVVGGYEMTPYSIDAFLYNGSTYAKIDDPLGGVTSQPYGPSGSTALGISGSYIVGCYYTSSQVRGFVYNGSTYTTLDDPLAGGNYYLEGTWVNGVSGNTIVGTVADGSNDRHGYLYDMLTGTFTNVDDPLALSSYGGTYAAGISGNRIVGGYYNSSGVHGCVYDGSTYTTLDDPVAVGKTYANGISENTVVGWYYDALGNQHGFIAIVPEPSTIILLGVGTATFAFCAWRMKQRTMMLLLFVVVVRSPPAVAQTYTTLDYPRAVNTELIGTDGDNVVGYYESPTYATYGFVYSLSTSAYTILNDPGVTGVMPSGVSGNSIVGYYLPNVSGPYHGFLFNGSSYTTLDDPSAGTVTIPSGTIATGISGGNVVGQYWDTTGEEHGLLFDGSTYTTLTAPQTVDDHLSLFEGSWASGISGNTIVGGYTGTGEVVHGFVYNAATKTFNPLDDPLGAAGAHWGTFPEGVFGNDIVGTYFNSSGAHGFLSDGSTFTTLVYPAGDPTNELTYLYGVSGNTIVGTYYVVTPSGVFNHGLLITVPEPSTFALPAVAATCLAAHGWRLKHRAK